VTRVVGPFIGQVDGRCPLRWKSKLQFTRPSSAEPFNSIGGHHLSLVSRMKISFKNGRTPVAVRRPMTSPPIQLIPFYFIQTLAMSVSEAQQVIYTTRRQRHRFVRRRPLSNGTARLFRVPGRPKRPHKGPPSIKGRSPRPAHHFRPFEWTERATKYQKRPLDVS
jgi:hypothetical protein